MFDEDSLRQSRTADALSRPMLMECDRLCLLVG